MNSSIEHLMRIAEKNPKLIIGLMSGTSLDGLDIALCKIEGTGAETMIDLLEFRTVDYPANVRERLASFVSVEEVKLKEVCLMHSWLGAYHADLILEVLHDWNMEPSHIDCIASHGQSIYHAPASFHKQKNMPNATLQLIDGDHIARKTGILTLSDFRQKHTAAGGEGAPMVALMDELLYSNSRQSRLLLNIGGIVNFTYLPSTQEAEEPITTDVGPGNTLIDHVIKQRFDCLYDEGGAIARSGTVHPQLLKILLDDPFFSTSVPRTTGPEMFNLNWLSERMDKENISEMKDDDLIATLTWFSAQTIADAILEGSGDDSPEIYLSGGGMHNTQLVEWIEKLLKQPTHSFAEIGFNPDAKEAVCFAILANETLSGQGFIIKPKQNAGRQVNFGKISLPV